MKKTTKITLKSIGFIYLSTLAAVFWITAIVFAALIIKYSIEELNIPSKKEFREAVEKVPRPEIYKEKVQAPELQFS
ncbi:MAG: hypothetical protein LBS54_01105 [Dysgonamonadaceae bacterium]|jgi:hypothetical protein|nr:hypothetical protein [Dysgonamonadaceae bacterium]